MSEKLLHIPDDHSGRSSSVPWVSTLEQSVSFNLLHAQCMRRRIVIVYREATLYALSRPHIGGGRFGAKFVSEGLPTQARTSDAVVRTRNELDVKSYEATVLIPRGCRIMEVECAVTDKRLACLTVKL
jgi:hypothetical protein